MLDAFIIDEIRRREQEAEHRREEQRPRQELPLPGLPQNRDEEEPVTDGGVTIVDYSIEGYSISV